MSAHFNTEDYILFQYKSIKKYVMNESELIIVNDAMNKKHYTNYYDDEKGKKLSTLCKKLKVKCLDFDQNLHINRKDLYPYELNDDFKNVKNNSNSRCADVTQYMYNYFIENYSKLDNVALLILDSDMFFTKNIDFNSILKNNDIVAVPQGRKNVHYFWNGIFLMNPANMKNIESLNWNCGYVNDSPTDVGGYTHYYIVDNKPNVKYISSPCYSYPHTINRSTGLPQKIKDLFLEICKIKKNNSCNKEYFLDSIIHLRGGGNWDHQGIEFMKKQNKLIYNYFID